MKPGTNSAVKRIDGDDLPTGFFWPFPTAFLRFGTAVPPEGEFLDPRAKIIIIINDQNQREQEGHQPEEPKPGLTDKREQRTVDGLPDDSCMGRGDDQRLKEDK